MPSPLRRFRELCEAQKVGVPAPAVDDAPSAVGGLKHERYSDAVGTN